MKVFLLFIYISALLISFNSVNAQSYCTDSTCTNTGVAQTVFSVGDSIPVFVRAEGQRALFWVTVDDLSVLTLSDCNGLFTNTTGTISVQAGGSNGIESIEKLYQNGAAYVSSWTVIISLVDGEVYSVDFDPQWNCEQCPTSTHCIDETCGTEFADGATCADRVNIFIAFIGTDVDGTPLESRSLSPSQYRSYSLGPVVDQVVSITNEFI